MLRRQCSDIHRNVKRLACCRSHQAKYNVWSVSSSSLRGKHEMLLICGPLIYKSFNPDLFSTTILRLQIFCDTLLQLDWNFIYCIYICTPSHYHPLPFNVVLGSKMIKGQLRCFSLPSSRVSVKFFVKMYFRLHERRASCLLGGISLLTTRYLAYRRAGKCGNVPYKRI